MTTTKVSRSGAFLIPIISLVLAMAGPAHGSGATDQDKKKPPPKTPEWTNHNDSDPGVTILQDKARLTARPADGAIDSVADDLQGIVVLCAKAPESAQYRETWLDFVRRGQVAPPDLDRVIFSVINDAEAYRGNHRIGRSETPDQARDRRARTFERMRRDALEVMARKKIRIRD
jgi:hypothetical protein